MRLLQLADDLVDTTPDSLCRVLDLEIVWKFTVRRRTIVDVTHDGFPDEFAAELPWSSRFANQLEKGGTVSKAL